MEVTTKIKKGRICRLDDVVFGGFFAALFLGSYLVDVSTRGEHDLNKQEKTLNQNLAESDARREVGRNNNQIGMF